MAFALIQNNLRAIFFMVFSMGLFAVEDTMIKLASSSLSVGQILLILSAAGSVVFAVVARLQGDALFSKNLLKAPVVLRNVGDVAGGILFITALTRMPLSNVSAILQATPLMVTLGAAIFLREAVGWRRWAAIIIGFIGVLIIIRPGMAGFNAASILAFISVIGFSMRDLATRRVDVNISTSVISAIAFFAFAPPAFILMQFQGGWQPVEGMAFWYLATACAIVPVSYYAITFAVRIGEMGAIAPFRYTRLIFAMLIGYFALGERPDFLMFAGSALVIASGIYAIYRERVQALRKKNVHPRPLE